MRNVRRTGLVCAVFAALGLYLPASTAQAGDILGARITRVQVYDDSTYYPYLVLELDQAGAGCQSPNKMTINIGSNKGRAMLSLATSAYLTGKKVNVKGANSCFTPDGLSSSIEIFRYLEVYE